jgi:hypothetical protein
LTVGLQAFPGPQCPLGEGLVGEKAGIIGQSSHETVIAPLTRNHGQRRGERLFMGFQIDVDGDSLRNPDMTPVGSKETGCRLTKFGEDTSGERESLGERP